MTQYKNKELMKDMCFLFYVSSKEIVNKFNKHLKQYDISFPNYVVMLYIENSNPVFIKTLCDQLYLDSGTISPIIKRLEKKGLIERMRTEEDERRVKVQLTQKGSVLKEKFEQISDEVLTQFNMSSEDIDIYYKLMKKFAEKNIYQ
ncbi:MULTISPECIES: MarR family transcriptional regulator [Staphylococcus]|uniref:HTH-type transcriptional regulator SarZ n=2 Tax=Staphylococcus TaxID=1279 RepID=A0AB34AI36_STAUR|nr:MULTISPECIES: MarR family transcriptional regulator [Staphylococcus]SCS63501.1 transcriptional regulator [Staphylococcus cohnii subsp. cohnii]AQM40372.1 MarR family transcriptional regulator [Staphylococcus cohnii]AVL78607.1 MarR family transcriptional regulator [Staphylococcus cohnii]MBL0375614.1 MarR family transcriptional regulator [Staphylococcus sp. S75]MBL0384130.1 MarR family transcriptional regulator [Staphylococcus sp. S59]